MKFSTLKFICHVAHSPPRCTHLLLCCCCSGMILAGCQQRASTDYLGPPRHSSIGSENRQATLPASSHIIAILTVHSSPLGGEPVLSLKAAFLISSFYMWKRKKKNAVSAL
ncbi:UNVERIFIED_CONTAM: hypothetical protein K2H54_055106 [Gekko kuhli]